VFTPWAHGAVARSTRYPSHYEFNVVRVETDPAMSAEALVAFADDALSGLAHRRISCEVIAAGERLRAGFDALGWQTMRVLWMRHDARLPPRWSGVVEPVPYDAVQELRLAWQHEDFPGVDAAAFLADAREIDLRQQVLVLAVRERGVPVAYAQLERKKAGAEIAQVYVAPEHRGRGHGTALTRAAIESAGTVRDLWIQADDEDRSKLLYARLGFRPAWTTMEFLRLV
jgi:GNAT superfamily N-acetyltransferase